MIKHSGFTLVEFMITVAIVGILTAVALPSYQSYSLKVKRSDAKLGLNDAADRQERYYLVNNAYAANSTALFGAAFEASPKGKYRITVLNGNSNSYTLRAVAQAEQTADLAACLTLEYSNAGVKGPAAALAAGCWD